MDVVIEWWNGLRKDFSEALVLGNGASIALDPAFGYSNLLEAARQDGLITQDLNEIFGYFTTSDFELVLTWLWHSYHVNKALGVDENRTTQAYRQLRRALVETVKKHHGAYRDVCDRLSALAGFLMRFGTVVSLNYDLLVYWTMMAGNEAHGNWFKDAFLSGKFKDEWEYLRSPFNAEGATLVFYPHGNLALATDLAGEERKLSVRSLNMGLLKFVQRDLLEEITKQWDDASVTPLFVAEGTSEQKLAAINRSNYLRSVFEKVLPKLGKSAAIYGWSASVNDTHILKQIMDGADRLAFSVTRQGGEAGAEQRCGAILNRIKSLEEARTIEVHFYWADSPGVWAHGATQ